MGAANLSLRKEAHLPVRWRVLGWASLFARLGARSGPSTRAERIEKRPQLPHALDRQHRDDPRRRRLAEHVCGLRRDRSGRAVGQHNDQEQRPVPALETSRLQHTPEQRVHRRRHTDLARQHAPEMLQCVAVPVGVGKTFIASALGHAAVRRRYSVVFHRADVMLKRLRASRLDNSHDAEMRKLLRVDLLILDLSRPRDYPDTAGDGSKTAWRRWGSGSVSED